jgi:hypothetical protein
MFTLDDYVLHWCGQDDHETSIFAGGIFILFVFSLFRFSIVVPACCVNPIPNSER